MALVVLVVVKIATNNMTTLTITDFKTQYLETRNEQRKGYGSEFALPSLKKQEHFIHNPTANGFDTEVTWELSYDPIIIYKNNVFKSSEIKTDPQEVKNGYKKPVDLFDRNGNYLQTFKSCTACAEYIGVCPAALSNYFKKNSSFNSGHKVKFTTNPSYYTPDKPNFDTLF